MNVSEISVLVLISIILLSFAAFFMVFLLFHNKKMIQNQHEIQRLELEKAKKTIIQSIEVQEAERARIGADIHDDLGPTLSAMKLKINSLTSDASSDQKNVIQLKDMIDDTIKTVRGLSHSLYPATLEKYGINNALKEMASRINSPDISFDVTITPEMENLSFSEKINIYRIAQEFTNNSIKHSHCSHISFNATYDNGIHITISDNGNGFEKEKINQGLGLKNMRMRAEAIDFSFIFDSERHKGTTIQLQQNNPSK